MPSEFGEEGDRETKDCGVKSDKTVFTWQDLSKFNQRHNAYVAVRGKVSITPDDLLVSLVPRLH